MRHTLVKLPNCCAVIMKSSRVLNGSKSYLVQMVYGYGDAGRHQSVTRHNLTALPYFDERWMVNPDHAEALEKARCYVSQIVWKPGGYDDLLIDVAEDRADPLLFAAADTGRVYSPYDGGADLFLEDKRTRDDLEEELKEITEQWQMDGH